MSQSGCTAGQNQSIGSNVVRQPQFMNQENVTSFSILKCRKLPPNINRSGMEVAFNSLIGFTRQSYAVEFEIRLLDEFATLNNLSLSDIFNATEMV